MDTLCTYHKNFGINVMMKNMYFSLLRTCNNYFKIILTLKTQFENDFYDIFWDIFKYTP